MKKRFTYIVMGVLLIGSLAACHQRGISSHAVSAFTTDADTAGRAQQEAFDSIWAPIYRRYANNNDGILTDLADSSLLYYGYSKYDVQDGKYFVYKGTMPRSNGRDSIKIAVAKRFGDSLTQVIYIRGMTDWFDMTGAIYDECDLILHQENGHWHVQDEYRNDHDYEHGEISMLGTYAGNYFLMKNKIAYGGHPFSGIHDMFYMISRDSFDCCGTSINDARNKWPQTFDMAYVVYHSDRDTCDIYDVISTIDFHYDTILDCIVFDYSINKSNSEFPPCSGSRPIDTTYHQIWYMNEDTIFLGKGDKVDFMECIATEKVNLDDRTLRTLLRKPARPYRGFKMYPGMSGRIEETFYDN